MNDIASDDRWFERTRETLSQLGGVTHLKPNDPLANDLSLRILHFGFEVGLVDDSAIVQILSGRWKRGLSLNAVESDIAALLSYQLDAVPLILRAADPALEEDREARAFWLFWVLRSQVDYWEAGEGDPLIDLQKLEVAWGDPLSALWERFRPRGLDALYFGSRARRHLVGRIAKWVSERGQVLFASAP